MQRRSKRQKRSGAAVVEAAITLPIVMLLILGVCELSWYAHCAQTLNNAARQGARLAVYHENSNAEVEAAVLSALNNAMGVDPDAVTVRLSKLNANGDEHYQIMSLDANEHGEPVQVQVTVNYAEVGLATNWLGLDDLTLSSYAVMQRKK